jgi:hypothetical protein
MTPGLVQTAQALTISRLAHKPPGQNPGLSGTIVEIVWMLLGCPIRRCLRVNCRG